MKTSYNAPFEHFKEAQVANCIIDVKWAKVLSDWYTYTSFGSVSS